MFLTIFNDDTRVNAGKKWSKTETHLVKLSGVPFSESTKDILFVTSAKTSSVDSGQAMTDGLAKLRVGVEGFDPIKRKKIILKGSVLINIGDGPAQSATCSHTGHGSNTPCRVCKTPKAWSGDMRQFLRAEPSETRMCAKEIAATILAAKNRYDALSTEEKPKERKVIEKELSLLGIKDEVFNWYMASEGSEALFMNPFLGNGTGLFELG